jgi:hypothetical protein
MKWRHGVAKIENRKWQKRSAYVNIGIIWHGIIYEMRHNENNNNENNSNDGECAKKIMAKNQHRSENISGKSVMAA